MSNTPSTATASASVAFPVASLAVFALLIMKLGNIAGLGDLSWWWVFSPWLISFGLFLAVVAVIAVVFGVWYVIAKVLDGRDARKREKARQARIEAHKTRLR